MPHGIGAAEDERSAEVQLTWLLATTNMAHGSNGTLCAIGGGGAGADREHGAPEDRASAAEASPYPASSREYGTGHRGAAGSG